MLGIIFLVCAIWYDWLLANQLGLFQFLYFFSSFWGQFGPNATTYVVPGEVFPTDVRAFFHGISAATGKVGAIAASQVFATASITTIFYTSAGCGFFAGWCRTCGGGSRWRPCWNRPRQAARSRSWSASAAS